MQMVVQKPIIFLIIFLNSSIFNYICYIRLKLFTGGQPNIFIITDQQLTPLMGNSQTHTKNTANSIQIAHPRFQNANLVKGKLDKQYLQIGISTKSEKDFIQWEIKFKKIPRVNAVLLPQSSKFENKGCCGSGGFAQIQYQNFPFVLSEQISTRAKTGNKYFKESQLWLLLYSILSSGQIFHIRKLKVGDIRPQNIFLNKQGQVKVGTQYSWPYETTNYYKSMHLGQTTYLAPEQTKDIKFGKMKDLNHPQVVQSFSTGLTVLDCAILQNSKNIYGDNVSFNYDNLNKKIQKLHKLQYSSQFRQMVEGLCQVQSTNRLLINQALKKLKVYQKQILMKQPFHLSWQNQVQNPQKNIKSQKDPNTSISSIGGGGYNFVPGVIYQSKDDTLLSSLNNSKQVIGIKKNPNIYTIAQGDKVTSYKTPVQTTIHYPPIINLPQPIQIQYQNNGVQH